MRHKALGGISALLLLVGCAHVRPSAPRPAAPPAAPQTAGSAQQPEPTATAPAQAAPPQPSTPSPAAQAGAEPGSAAVGGEPAPRAGATSSSRGNAKTKEPARGESTVAAAPRATAHGGASPSTAAAGAAAPPAQSSAPTLDLPSLEQRLKDTRAIGVFTKLSLKNQVDDLLAEFRAFHGRQGTLKVSDLRQRYDLLLLKVLSLLQDGDPSLAAAISSSREAIWEILIDPQKFQKLAST